MTPLPSAGSYDIVVFCHLRWEFVYQRPQHIVSRLAKHGRVLFIEEPIPFSPEEENTVRVIPVSDRITVWQPRVSHIGAIRNLFPAGKPVPAKIGWVYSPAFVEMLDLFSFEKIVYDCMDELSLFRGADPALARREKELLERADTVFTGGKSLYESKSRVHPNVHCFPSSVDRTHFGKALNGIPVPDDIRMEGPVVGYYGVIDERIDMDLLARAAERMPSVNFVMVGPLAKISDNDMAKAPNIRYLGMKPYTVLPNYLKAFDVAMMPFALNDATRYISPTKTLEFMAAHNPIVSTPVYDVVRDYAHCIAIAADADAFCEAVDRLLEPGARETRTKHFDRILETTSWDHTVESMRKTINL